jgi:hypothetical protein
MGETAPSVLNQVYLTAIVGEEERKYPCILLDPNVTIPPQDRDIFVEIGDGHLPIRARIWMTSEQLLSLPGAVRNGKQSVGMVMKGAAVPWGEIGGDVNEQTLLFAKAFFVVRVDIARAGIDETVYAVWLETEQWRWQYEFLDGGINVLSPEKYVFVEGANGPASPRNLDEVIDDLLPSGLGVSVGSTKWTPFNLTSSASIATMIPRALSPLSMHLVANPFLSNTTLIFSVASLSYQVTDATLSRVLTLSRRVSYEGANVATSIGNTNIPGEASVFCTRYPADFDQDEPYYHKIKTSISPQSSSRGQFRDRIFIGDRYKTSYNPRYTTDLDAHLESIADERITRFWNRVLIDGEIYVLIGGYPVVPGSQIRYVRISMDHDGWLTTVVTHNRDRDHREEEILESPTTSRNKFRKMGRGFGNIVTQDGGAVNIEIAEDVRTWMGYIQDGETTATGINDSKDNPVQWTYKVKRALKGAAGYGGWLQLGPLVTARNRKEEGNTGVGRQMNGVDHDSFVYQDNDLAMQPIRGLVKIRTEYNHNGAPEHWFSEPNTEDGECAT